MNILVIGNGFDLAHGLPTKYENFLEFCERVKGIYDFPKNASLGDYRAKYIDNWKMNDYIKTALLEDFERKHSQGVKISNKALEELYKHIRQNTWLEYFLKCHSFVGENWIDFEMEISRVIQSLDQLREVTKKNLDIQQVDQEKQEILMSLLKASKGSTKTDYGSIKGIDNYVQFLNVELERLIRALEIYIAEFIAKISTSLRNSDIGQLAIGHVLSFNYSDTYKKLYGANKKIRYDYIHGIANINNTLQSNNMVLGIDEYLSIEKRDKEIEFIAFKKYYSIVISV